ncbi:MAG: hypothetical protein K9N21_02280 [Deltaproteobacteria bacterium]|nr:hypothetical protein [Deltaproteobacteria bacterium]
MAEKVDEKEIVTFKELLMSQVIQLDAVTQLLIEKGLITEEEFYAKLKAVQGEYERRGKE